MRSFYTRAALHIIYNKIKIYSSYLTPLSLRINIYVSYIFRYIYDEFIYYKIKKEKKNMMNLLHIREIKIK